jgi:hypothetical protein
MPAESLVERSQRQVLRWLAAITPSGESLRDGVQNPSRASHPVVTHPAALDFFCVWDPPHAAKSALQATRQLARCIAMGFGHHPQRPSDYRIPKLIPAKIAAW